MKLDLKNLADGRERTFDFEVGRNDVGEPIGFRLLGPMSEAYAKIQREIEIVNLMESAKRKVAVQLDTREGAEFVVDTVIGQRLMLLGACVVDWFGVLDDGAPAVFSTEALLMMMAARPDLAESVSEAIKQIENFTGG